MLFKESDHLELRQIKTIMQMFANGGRRKWQNKQLFPSKLPECLSIKELDQGVRPEAHTSPSATKKGCSDKSFCM